MKYSILFLNYDPDDKLAEMTKDTLYRVVKNSRGQDYELIILDRKGIETDQNRGLAQARGEYIVFVCNDMVLDDPQWLQKLAVPDQITSWRSSVSHWGFHEIDCSLFCIPRPVFEKVGYFDTAYQGNYGYSDNDYLMRAHRLGIPLVGVPIDARHLEMQTFKQYPLDGGNSTSVNKEYFKKKFNLAI